VKSSGASIGAAGTNVVTAVSLARSLNMAGIIVSQTIAGQTIATNNKGQTVVAPFLQVLLLVTFGLLKRPLLMTFYLQLNLIH